jgi:hypothetical protein
MIKKSDVEQQKAAMLKAARAAIRLKHAIRADAEINERLPEIEGIIDEALADGEALELTAESFWGETVDEA